MTTAAARPEPAQEPVEALRKAIRYEWLTVFFLLTIIAALGSVVGSSQAMRTAWIEDMLGLLTPAGFLIANRVAKRAPDRKLTYGYHRAISIAFLCGSFAIAAMGFWMLYGGVHGLIQAKHPTIGEMKIFGYSAWQGWFMIAALVYSAVPPVILGRMKIPLARTLHDKALFADARMNRADWTTALAAALGVLGIGLGWWWADAVAAIFISLSAVHDGIRNLRSAVADLCDRIPMTVDDKDESEIPGLVQNYLHSLPWVDAAAVRLREEGRLLMGEAFVVPREHLCRLDQLSEAREEVSAMSWRIRQLAIVPVREIPPMLQNNSKGDENGSANAGDTARKTGDFVCDNCGNKVHVTQGDKIPKCPECENDTFGERRNEPDNPSTS